MKRFVQPLPLRLVAMSLYLAIGMAVPLSAEVPLQATTPEGKKLWIVSVTPQFRPSDMEAIGGKCHWHWKNAGIALASSDSVSFEADAESGTQENIVWAVPDLIVPDQSLQASLATTRNEVQQAADQAGSRIPENYSSPHAQSFGLGNELLPVTAGADVYAVNGQWSLYAIGAARPMEIDPIYSQPVHTGPGPKVSLYKTHYTPEWQLDKIDGHDYAGSGVTIGFVDTGIPAVWLDGDERSIPLLDDDGLPVLDSFGQPVLVHDSVLHPEFDWYDPDHPEEGGIVPPGFDEGVPDWMRLDRFDDHSGHGTATMGLCAAKYSKRVYGAMRGLSPRAKYYCYSHAAYGDRGIHLSKILRAWKRAAADGVQILNNSWTEWNSPKDYREEWLEHIGTLTERAANELSRQGVLLVTGAANDSTWLERDHGFPSFFRTFPNEAPNVITVAGTAPRDYWPIQFAWEPKFDLNIYMPDAAGRPYDPLNRLFNLDRPMIVYFWPPYLSAPTFLGGTNFGAAIDVAAPAGSEDDRPFFDPDNPQWPAFEIYRSTNNLIYTTFPLPDALFLGSRPELDYGFHTLYSGNSFAGPHTCGVAALVAEAYERRTGERPSVATLRQLVIQSADDLVGPITEDQPVYDPYFHEDPDYPCERIGQDFFYGFGRVNAFKAILDAKNQ